MLFADLASKFFIKLTFEFGVNLRAECSIARAADEVFECFRWLVPCRGIVMVGDGVFRAAILAGHVMLRAKVFAREDSKTIVAINARFAEFKWPEILCINRWAVHSF